MDEIEDENKGQILLTLQTHSPIPKLID